LPIVLLAALLAWILFQTPRRFVLPLLPTLVPASPAFLRPPLRGASRYPGRGNLRAPPARQSTGAGEAPRHAPSAARRISASAAVARWASESWGYSSKIERGSIRRHRKRPGRPSRLVHGPGIVVPHSVPPQLGRPVVRRLEQSRPCCASDGCVLASGGGSAPVVGKAGHQHRGTGQLSHEALQGGIKANPIEARQVQQPG
jgi:hypothetical protein